MNSETRDLLRKLEQATSTGDVNDRLLDERLLDEETAQLREGWLALGRILDDSNRSPVPPAPIHLARRNVYRVGWIVACAMGLLATIFAGWYSAAEFLQFQRLPTPVAGGDELPQESPAVSDTVATTSNELSEATPESFDGRSTVELAWDDAFDDQLARAGYAIWQARGTAPNYDQAWSFLYSELQSISSDLEGESL